VIPGFDAGFDEAKSSKSAGQEKLRGFRIFSGGQIEVDEEVGGILFRSYVFDSEEDLALESGGFRACGSGGGAEGDSDIGSGGGKGERRAGSADKLGGVSRGGGGLLIAAGTWGGLHSYLF